MRFWICFLAMIALAGPAVSGAWPREPGTFFLSVSQRVSTEIAALRSVRTLQPDTYSAFYAEYGASKRLTFGLDGGYSSDGPYGGLAFARMALGPLDGKHKFALVAGAGIAGPPRGAQIQLGAAWGHGFSFGNRWTGWTGIDASAIQRMGSAETILKADLTLGLTPSERLMTIFQLQTGKYPGSAAYLRAAPSIVFRTGKSAQIQIGADYDLLGSGRVGASLATWIEF